MEFPGLSSQQVAGRPCHVCGDRVLLEIEGQGCPHCNIAWHRTCTETPVLCPVCGKDAAVAAKAVVEAQKREVSDVLDRGRTLYFVLLALHVLGTLLLLFCISISSDITSGPTGKETGSIPYLQALFAFTFFFLFWLGAYFGVTAARYILAVAAWIPIVLGILIAVGDEWLPDGFLNRSVSVSRGTPRKGTVQAEQAATKASARAKREKDLKFGEIVFMVLTTGTALYTVIICCFDSTIRNYEFAMQGRRRTPAR